MTIQNRQSQTRTEKEFTVEYKEAGQTASAPFSNLVVKYVIDKGKMLNLFTINKEQISLQKLKAYVEMYNELKKEIK